MQTLLRRLAALGIALAALFSLFPCQTHAVSTSASSAILMDVDSGRVLYEQNADAKMLIASTTKILTALVAIREGDLNDVVTVSREAAYTEGSSMYLKVGEKLTLETLLYGLLLCSGNDAAVAIAEHISGSQEDFAKLMNATAREIGMEHSSFANPNGLDHEDHYSTARDMARLACAAARLAAVTDLEGEPIRPARVEVLRETPGTAVLAVTIHEGKNRQVRRMCAQCGLTVKRLRRVREGALELGDLPPGKWRYLTQDEAGALGVTP